LLQSHHKLQWAISEAIVVKIFDCLGYEYRLMLEYPNLAPEQY